jgi:hypothetical protein
MKKILKRSIIIGIIFLFISTISLPVSAKNNTIKSTSDQVDNNDEIITFISGNNLEGIATQKWGIIRDVRMTVTLGIGGFDIKGWKQNPIERFSYTTLGYIHAPHFLGFCIPTNP